MMKASEARLILNGLEDDHEVRLDIGFFRKDKGETPVPPPTTIYDPNTRDWVIGRQFWPKQDINPYPNYVYCTNTGTMQ